MSKWLKSSRNSKTKSPSGELPEEELLEELDELDELELEELEELDELELDELEELPGLGSLGDCDAPQAASIVAHKRVNGVLHLSSRDIIKNLER